MGTGNLPRLCDTALFNRDELSRSFAAIRRRNRLASGSFPTAPYLQPFTGRRPGLKPAAPKPRVPPTRVATPADNLSFGSTTAP